MIIILLLIFISIAGPYVWWMNIMLSIPIIITAVIGLYFFRLSWLLLIGKYDWIYEDNRSVKSRNNINDIFVNDSYKEKIQREWFK